MKTAWLLRVGLFLLGMVLQGIPVSGGERGPFEALREGRVRTVPGPWPAASTGAAVPFSLLVPGRLAVEVRADGTFRLEGLPVDTPVRVHLVPRAMPPRDAGSTALTASPPVILAADPTPAASVDVPPPGSTPPVVRDLDLVGPAGAHTLTFALSGQVASLAARGRSVTGTPLDPAEVAGNPGLRFEASNPPVAEVSASGEVTSRGDGLGWIRLSGDGEWAQVLVHVDPGRDTDRDGLPDSYEVAAGLDPSDPEDAGLDPDGDGLSTLEEFELGTNPLEADTDGDLLDDGAEVLEHGTDPFLADTDGDFSLDGSEVAAGRNPLDPNDKPGSELAPSLERSRSLSSTAVRAAISDSSHAYIISEGGRITSYRIDPSNYFLIFNDTEVLPGELRDIAVLGSVAYVAAGDDGLHRVDVSNPAVLSLEGTKTGLGPVYGVAVGESRVYVAGGLGLWVLEPRPDGSLETLGALGVPAFSRLAVSEPIVFLGIPGGNRLISVDVSDPTAPRELERLAMPLGTLPFRALESAGSLVVVAHGGAGLVTVSAADPGNMELVDTSTDEFPGAFFDAVARVGSLMVSHTPADDTLAQIYRLADDGRLEPAGSVEADPLGAVQLVGHQNFVLSLSETSFSVSEILPSADRGTTAPVGTLLLEGDGQPFTPGGLVRFRARVRDDVYVESVEFRVDGRFLARDFIPPFHDEVRLDSGTPPPYFVTIEAWAFDLAGNSSSLGSLIVPVEADLDGDGLADSIDPDVDGDGASYLEERFPGEDGYVTDPLREDTDGDGITDGEEASPGEDGYVTDGASADTDQDGLTDPFEIASAGTDPRLRDTDGDGVEDGDEDGDGDGLANRDEADLGTDPGREDTDGDGVPDGAEVALGLDPLETDTDGDGVPDGQEDPDGDGLPTAEEIALGLDPTEPDTDFDGFDDPTEVDLGTDPAGATDFSSLAITFTSKTVTLRGAVTVATLTLEDAVLTVPPATGAETHPLDLTVLGSLRLDAPSRIDVSGRGFPGGRTAGNPAALGLGPVGLAAGRELTGGSHGGLGGHPDGLFRGDAQPAYGHLERPHSAGGGGSAALAAPGRGGNGGGVVWLRAGEIELGGTIVADGEGAPEVPSGAAGAGGSIWIECTRIGGAGEIRAHGGSAPGPSSPQPGGGGGGRISIHAQDATGLDRVRVTARGGGVLGGPDHPAATGGAGTVVIREGGGGVGDLIVENGGRAQDAPSTILSGAGEGTVAEVGDNFLVRLEGDFPPGVVGLEIDPDAENDELQAFEILAVSGNRIITAPGLLEATRPGARYEGIFRFDDLSVLDGGMLATDVLLAVRTGSGALRMAGGSTLETPTLRVGGPADVLLEDAALSVGRLWLVAEDAPGITLVRSDAWIDTGFRSGPILLEESLLVAGGALSPEGMTLEASTVTVPEPTAMETHALELNVSGELSIDGSSALDVTARGYLGGGRGDDPPRIGQTADHALLELGGRTGGSHGGLGGVQGTGLGLGLNVAPIFDDLRNPRRPGGGGSGRLNDDDRGHNGGGLLRVRTARLVLNGRLVADGGGVQQGGSTDTGGAGAGGGIYLDVDELLGSGEVSADGGSADGGTGAGCGGGGRIAILYGELGSFTGSVHALGGVLVPDTPKASSVGGAGTVFWQSREQLHGDLVIDNAGRVQSAASTPLRAVGTGTIVALAQTTLEGDIGFETSDTGLEGHWVVVNEETQDPFRILGNTATVLETDPATGDLTTVGAPGDPFQGAHVLDNLTVTGSAKVSSGGDLIILTGEVTVSDGGVLTAPPIVQR